MKFTSDSAVSPVIGVLLMLVVTIIIAAIVSSFAGGLSSEESKTPQASLAAKVVIENISDTDTTNYVPDYPTDFTAKNGIQFEHKGGDPITLDDISMELENQGVTMIVSGSDKLPSSKCLPTGTTDGGFFAKIASTTSDKVIEPGDKFMFYADNCYISSGTKYLLWTLSSGKGYGVINGQYKYSLIDKKSGKVITTGSFIMK